MRRYTVRGFAVLVVAVSLGVGAGHVRAASIGGGPTALLAKVYRVFGDDEPPEDGVKATKRAPRKRCRRALTKRPRVERNTTRTEGDSQTGVLELLDPNA